MIDWLIDRSLDFGSWKIYLFIIIERKKKNSKPSSSTSSWHIWTEQMSTCFRVIYSWCSKFVQNESKFHSRFVIFFSEFFFRLKLVNFSETSCNKWLLCRQCWLICFPTSTTTTCRFNSNSHQSKMMMTMMFQSEWKINSTLKFCVKNKIKSNKKKFHLAYHC